MDLKNLDAMLKEVVWPKSETVDREASFPRHTLNLLKDNGLLGLISAKDVGGKGENLKAGSNVIRLIANSCPSSAMVTTMHFCGTTVLEKYGDKSIREKIAKGEHITTLAWSEMGSRSHFWAPVGTAKKGPDGVVLNSKKSWVTSAIEADSYVWSTSPMEKEGASSLWFVGSKNQGITQPGTFDGLGLRGNASSPLIGENVKVSENDLLGEDGKGFDIMIGDVLPVFSTLIASSSLGIMEGALERALEHLKGTKYQHLGSGLVDLPTIRSYIAQAVIKKDMVKTLLDDTIEAILNGREDAMLRVMQVKAAAAESTLQVTDTCMRVCGGAAFRKDLAIERFFRDARASFVMAPTSDVLYDFIGKAVCGLPVFE